VASGLSFETGIRVGSRSGTSSGPPTTATEAAFGSGYSGSRQRSGLFSSGPASYAFWGGTAAAAGLFFLRRSLPANRRTEFDLILMMLVLWGPAKGLARMSLQRLSQEPQTSGAVDDLARAGVWVLS